MSPGTWDHFNYYTPLIRQLDLRARPDVSIPTPCLLQILTLPGRPDTFFPNLEAITMSQIAHSERDLLFILIGPALQTVNIAYSSEIHVLNQIPANWNLLLSQASGDNSAGLQTLLAAVPKLAFSSPHLQSFRYCGLVSRDFFLQIGSLKSLTSLDLTLASYQDASILFELRQPHLLEMLKLVAPSLSCTMCYSSVTAAEEWLRSTGNHENHFPHLHTLWIEAREYTHLATRQCLKPRRLHSLTLCMTGVGVPHSYHLCLGNYLHQNQDLQTLYVEFIESGSTDPFPANPFAWPSASEAADSARSALALCVHLSDVFFVNILHTLSGTTASLLCSSMPSWKKLKDLTFHVKTPALAVIQPNTTSNTNNFPGLSFLADTIWADCLVLGALGFEFDLQHFHEDVVRRIEDEVSQPPDHKIHQERYSSGHPLKRLTINTPTGGSQPVVLEGLITTTRYLERYFPLLTAVKGQGVMTNVWFTVKALVQSHRLARQHAYSQLVYNSENGASECVACGHTWG
ncbi:hypothetical protein FA13DRAFT_1790547 [Coprinellus micaceus]|uniref:F-box domain-containing protein n=1 Tax=Coprinellus micaceus TaxID=71717 RepID=A0A4Y7TFD4_COPMI|nr:hypothetical protein FA13DRAFT_1790547 [Coprinellus micaceus]